MDLKQLDAELDRLRSIPVPPSPAIEALEGRGARRRHRAALVAVVVTAAVVGAGLLGGQLLSGDDTQVVSSGGTDEPGSTGERRVPEELVGMTLADARDAMAATPYRLAVNEGDPRFGRAVVIAAEPSSRSDLRTGDVVGVRTALPDPPASAECAASRHPRDEGGTGDGLPSVESIERGSAEAALLRIRDDDQAAYLAQWGRAAFRTYAGLTTTFPAKGFQIVVAVDPADCPGSPHFDDGVPVTYVTGPVSRWAGPVVTLPTRGEVRDGRLSDGRNFQVRDDLDRGLCVIIDNLDFGCDEGGVVSGLTHRTAVRFAIDPASPNGDRALLAYGYLPPGVHSVEVSGPGVGGVAGFINGDGSAEVWAVPLTDGEHDLDEIEVVYRFSDGHSERAPRS
jgi:hypothetical protein